MSTSERKLVAEAWANAVGRTKQHLMIQVGGTSLPDVLELVRKEKDIHVTHTVCDETVTHREKQLHSFEGKTR